MDLHVFWNKFGTNLAVLKPGKNSFSESDHRTRFDNTVYSFECSVLVDLVGDYQPTNPLARTLNICLKNAMILCMKFSAAFLGPESHTI